MKMPLLRSDIGRLVYGFLRAECNEGVAEEFLNEYKPLLECRRQKELGYNFCTKVQNLQLAEILNRFLSLLTLFERTNSNEMNPHNLPSVIEGLLQSKLDSFVECHQGRRNLDDSLSSPPTSNSTVPHNNIKSVTSMKDMEVQCEWTPDIEIRQEKNVSDASTITDFRSLMVSEDSHLKKINSSVNCPTSVPFSSVQHTGNLKPSVRENEGQSPVISVSVRSSPKIKIARPVQWNRNGKKYLETHASENGCDSGNRTNNVSFLKKDSNAKADLNMENPEVPDFGLESSAFLSFEDFPKNLIQESIGGSSNRKSQANGCIKKFTSPMKCDQKSVCTTPLKTNRDIMLNTPSNTHNSKIRTPDLVYESPKAIPKLSPALLKAVEEATNLMKSDELGTKSNENTIKIPNFIDQNFNNCTESLPRMIHEKVISKPVTSSINAQKLKNSPEKSITVLNEKLASKAIPWDYSLRQALADNLLEENKIIKKVDSVENHLKRKKELKMVNKDETESAKDIPVVCKKQRKIEEAKKTADSRKRRKTIDEISKDNPISKTTRSSSSKQSTKVNPRSKVIDTIMKDNDPAKITPPTTSAVNVPSTDRENSIIKNSPSDSDSELIVDVKLTISELMIIYSRESDAIFIPSDRTEIS